MLALAVVLLIRDGTMQRHRAVPGVEPQVAVFGEPHPCGAFDLQPDLRRVGARGDDEVVFEPLRIAVEHGIDPGIEVADLDPGIGCDISVIGDIGASAQMVDPRRLQVDTTD